MPPARLVASGMISVEQLAQVGVFVAREVVAVGLAEGAEPLDLDALAGVVLPHELAAGEADALAAARAAVRSSTSGGCVRASGTRPAGARRQQARGGHRLHVGEDAAQLGAARAAIAARRSVSRRRRPRRSACMRSRRSHRRARARPAPRTPCAARRARGGRRRPPGRRRRAPLRSTRGRERCADEACGVDECRAQLLEHAGNDPDGNTWLVQEVTTRAPGRV